MVDNQPAPRVVLITRPEPDASETAALLAARGFVPVIGPVMRLERRPAVLDAGATAGVAAVLVASRHALAGLPESLHGTPLLAVGSATAARAAEAGFTRVHDAAGDAAALAALAAGLLPMGARVLLAHGQGQGDGLFAVLTRAGFAVTRLVAYAVVPAERLPEAAADALRGLRLDAALFLSAETARTFVRLLPTGWETRVSGTDAVAIGAAAADALAPLPWRRVRVSLRPTLDEVLALL